MTFGNWVIYVKSPVPRTAGTISNEIFLMDCNGGNVDFITCLCTNCSGRIEFPASGVGMEIECPHCKLQTKLYQPSAPLKKSGQPEIAGRSPKQKLVVGSLIAICLAILICVGWSKYNTAKVERVATNARRELHNEFAFQFSSLLTTLKYQPSKQSGFEPSYEASLQYGVQPYLDYFDTNIRMYGGWLNSDEQDQLNRLIDELQGIQFFAKKSNKEGMFARLSDEDKQMITHCNLSSDKRVWNAYLVSIEKNHPIIEAFRQSLIEGGFDPDSAEGMKACFDYANSVMEKARAEKTAYDAMACVDIMVDKTTNTVSHLFDDFTQAK